MSRYGYLVALLLGISGCGTPGPLVIDDIKGTEARLTGADAVDIALAVADRDRVDRYVKAAFGEHKYGAATGVFWRRAFTGGAGAPLLSVKSATLTEAVGGGGFNIRYTYTAKCELSYMGRTYPIEAEGTRGAAMYIMSAMRQAVELGVVDAAKKAKAIVSANR